MTTATMDDDDAFRAFRKIGLPEGIAAKVARIIRRDDRRDDEFVTKVERDAERAARQAEREAARAGREAERKADREAFAEKSDVAVLQSEMSDVKAAIVRIDATLVSMKELLARMDERINGIESQSNKFFYIFFSLHIVTITGLIGLLTKGVLWGVAP